MENRSVDRHERVDVRVEDLHLDRVVASHPEIGPTPPDGGYGWLIVVSAMIYYMTVPAVFSVYGFVILKALREEDHEENEVLKIWDVDITLVPVMMIVIRLLLESWCRAIVKTFNMPRFIALSGLCLTVAGVLLSSYSTDANSNDHIINIFAGIFVGSGCALTGQQTEVIITHYFRDKLTFAQRLLRMAPSFGNCLVPILIGYLSTVYTADVVIMIYGAILMQNCVFLASYTRPIYIEKVIRSTYNMLRDAVEDEDEVIYSNQTNDNASDPSAFNSAVNEAGPANVVDDANDVVVFNSNKNAKEIIDPEIQYRDRIRSEPQSRFSSDFSAMPIESNRFSSNFSDNVNENRFSSDFGTFHVNTFGRNAYRELENIDSSMQNPQPLYRDTTVDAPQSNIVFPGDMTQGTERRTASMKKHFIAVTSMLADWNFYLYVLLHLCTTFSILTLGVFFPPMVWEQNPSMNIWSIALLTAMAHGSALCFILLCIALPNSINEKLRLCAAFCAVGAVGFFGITVSGHKSFLVAWCMVSSISTASTSILLQPPHKNSANDFDTTATLTTSNAIVAIALMIWAIVYNYSYKTCFWIATLLQIVTASAYFVSSFRRRR